MQEQLNRIEAKTDAVYNRLVGDEELKQPGLIDEVQANTKHRKTQAKKVGFLVGVFSAIGTGLGWLGHKIIEFFTQ